MATSSEVDLGDEDSPDAVDAMLRHIYGLPFISGRDVEEEETDWPNFLIDVFEVSDKYDVPTLSDAVIKNLEKNYLLSDQFILGIQRHCGPTAKQLADKSLQRAMMRICVKHMSQLVEDKFFTELDEQGEIFAPVLSARLRNEISVEPQKDGRSDNFFSVTDIIESCDGIGYTLGSSVGGSCLPEHVMETAHEQIKTFLYPLSRADFVKHFRTIPEGLRTECVWTRVEGQAQSTNDELNTCRRCREKNRVCLMRSRRSHYPIFVGLKDQEFENGSGMWGDAAFWMREG